MAAGRHLSAIGRFVAVDRIQTQPTSRAHAPAPAAQPEGLTASRAFVGWLWAVVPALAVAAYITAFRVGFLIDDLQFLRDVRGKGVDLQALLPDPTPIYGLFYRPVGSLLTWQLGWQLWGDNPLPYHVQSVLLHAGVALFVGLCAAEVSGQRLLGWLSGALFAVFPLHTEAVAWLSAQWDVWAALFGALSLWFFVRGWRAPEGAWPLYAGAMLSYLLALLSKESVLAFLAVFPVAAWLATPRFGRRDLRRLAVYMLPFGAVLGGVVLLRFVTWGQIGGYRRASTDIGGFLWDHLARYGRAFVAPLNPEVVGVAAAQFAGVLGALLLLAALLVFGRGQRKVLIFALTWIIAALLPVLNLAVEPGDLRNNRLAYLASAGYCIALASLVFAFVSSFQRGRWAVAVRFVPVALLLGGVALSWLHLRPWHTVTVMTQELDRNLARYIPPQPGFRPTVWHVENLPMTFRGALAPWLFLGYNRYLDNGQPPQINTVPGARDVLPSLSSEQRDAFAMRFRPVDPADPHYTIDYLAGITNEGPPPDLTASDPSLELWDFRECAADNTPAWEVSNAKWQCDPERGLVLTPTSDDPQLYSPDLALRAADMKATFVRVRVAARYPTGEQTGTQSNRLYWSSDGEAFADEKSSSFNLKSDGNLHVYWTYIPVSELEGTLTGLRFDPSNARVTAEIQWIAVDVLR